MRNEGFIGCGDDFVTEDDTVDDCFLDGKAARDRQSKIVLPAT